MQIPASRHGISTQALSLYQIFSRYVSLCNDQPDGITIRIHAVRFLSYLRCPFNTLEEVGMCLRWNYDWFPLSGQAVFDLEKQQVAVVSRAEGNLDLFVIGFDNRIWSTFWSAAGGWGQESIPLTGPTIIDHMKKHV